MFCPIPGCENPVIVADKSEMRETENTSDPEKGESKRVVEIHTSTMPLPVCAAHWQKLPVGYRMESIALLYKAQQRVVEIVGTLSEQAEQEMEPKSNVVPMVRK